MQTKMEIEAAEAPQVVKKQLADNQDVLKDLCQRLRKQPPRFALTIARGSSDHAATFAKYLLETNLGLITASAAPSVLTLYNGHLHFKNALVIGLSQSGKSPDLAEVMDAAREDGAITVAFVNQADSPLAHAAEYVIPLCAGAEHAVAATKSYIATLSALLHFTATFSQNKSLIDCLQHLPDALSSALQCDWSAVIPHLLQQKNTLVVARGFGFPIAQETALKFKETTGIHAEAFSGAELMHGPFALVQKDFPLFFFTQKDNSLPGMLELAQRVKSLGAKTLVAIPQDVATEHDLKEIASLVLPLPAALHPSCDPLLVVQAFYPMVAQLAVRLGLNPDNPQNLKKVTETW